MMLTPQRWALVMGFAFAFVAVAGAVMAVAGGEGGFAWVIVGFAAVSSLAAFAVARAQRRRAETSEIPGVPEDDA